MLAILGYVVVATLLSKITVAEERNTPNEVAIYILTNVVHTDIVVPSRTSQMDWTIYIKPEHTEAATNEYPYLALGWGDKGFYLNTPTLADLKFSTAFKAATGFSTSAMHATYYYGMTESENCIKIIISKKQYERLVKYLKNSFEITKNGSFNYINTTNNYNTTDAFYEAKGSYSIFKTCNSWANSGLKFSGQKATFWTATDTSIFEKQ
jgi:uncharacterized protein (TIGR02117 family)